MFFWGVKITSKEIHKQHTFILDLPIFLFPFGFPTKLCMHLFSLPYVPHAPPIQSYVI